MTRQIDGGLADLNEKLITMAGYVEMALERATDGWRLRDVSKLQEVYEIEKRVNRAHIEVDARCFRLLALQSPLAADLRLIVAIIKINTDLERMVDLAVNIANNTEYYLKGPQQVGIDELSLMADEVRVMVGEVLDAFVRRDQGSAHGVLLRDDRVDSFKRQIVAAVMAQMKREPMLLEQGLNVILIAKNLERIGDHATNIAEDVIFTTSGEDIRHAEKKRNG